MDETQNDAPFVAFYDMHAVTFVPPDEKADATITGLQWFILIPPIKPHGVPQANWFPFQTLLTLRKKYRNGIRTTQPAAILRITRKAAVLILVASYDMP